MENGKWKVGKDSEPRGPQLAHSLPSPNHGVNLPRRTLRAVFPWIMDNGKWKMGKDSEPRVPN
jgi:hypothetical protein